MGSSSKQVIGYKYFTNLLLFVGNPIEKMLGINFDKRGWISPFVDENGNALAQGVINSPNLYGENEGGVAGVVHVQYGGDNQEVLPFYKAYMDSKELPASAFPYQSYLAFTGLGAVNNTGLIGGVVSALMPQYNNAFYVGNSGYMKEMLLWPKRTRIRNDGRRQWYEFRGDGAIVCEIGAGSGGGGGVLFPKADTPSGKTFRSTSNWVSSTKGTYTETQTTAFKKADDLPMLTEEIINNWKVGLFFKPDTVGYDTYSNEGQATWWIAHHVDFNYSNAREDLRGDGATTTFNLSAFDEDRVIFFEFFSRAHMEEITIEGADWFLSRFTELGSFSVAGSSAPVRHAGALYLKRGQTLNGKFVTRMGADGEGTELFTFANMRFFFVAAPATSNFEEIGTDINPIHKIREILTDDTAMNKPEASVNKDNFIKAADRIYDEGLGISWSITEKSCIDAINELCYHIEAGIRVNRQTGLYEMVLFRDDWFEEDEIHTIAESKIKSMQYEITNADEVINQVNVNYYDRANIKNSSFSISENGLIQTLGRVNAETLDFPYFMNMRNAEVVANWKLKQLSTGAFKGSFTTGWREARKWNRYDLIRLPWSKRWTGTILVRIMSINLGGPTNNEVSIDFIEVVPATGMMNTSIVIDDPIDKPLPPQACQYEPFELPYYLAVMAIGQRKVDEELAYENNFGLVGVVAEQPQSNSLYAIMKTHPGVAGEEWLRAATINYDVTADLDQIISKISSSFTVKNWKKITNIPIGTLIKCGRDWLGAPSEWMVFQGVDPYTGIVSVKRGALDTLPQAWGIDSKLYFCGNDVSYDQTEYISGEEILVSALTTTPSGVLEQGGSIPIEMKARAIRPYPLANVKINDVYWPTEIETDLVLTWVDRNRIQQTGGSILGWYEGGVTIEPGTQTHLILTQLDENDVELSTTSANVTGTTSYTFPISSMQVDVRAIRVVLKTLKNGYECLNPFIHTVELSQFFSAPYDLTVEFKND